MTWNSIRYAAILACPLMLACGMNDQASPPELTGVFSVSSRGLWAGESLWVMSPDLEFLDQVALQVGSDTIAVSRVDDTTIAVAIPDTIGGDKALTLLAEDQLPTPLGSIAVYGFESFQMLSPFMSGDIYIYPRGGPASIMGSSFTPGGLTILNLESGLFETWPINDAEWLRGPGPTPDPDVFLVRSAQSMVKAYRLGAMPVLVDSAPGCYSDRQVMLMSPGICFASAHHAFTVTGQPPVQAEETEGVYLSPKGDRATIQVDGMEGLVPVFNAATGAVAYTLPIHESEGVYFSDDGELLAVAGKTVNNDLASRILLLSATSGTVLGDTTIAQHAFNVAIDPVRPYLYVGAIQSNGRPEILVLRRSDFGLVARLPASASADECVYGCYKGVVVVGASDVLFAANGLNADGTRSYRFRLPPAVGLP